MQKKKINKLKPKFKKIKIDNRDFIRIEISKDYREHSSKMDDIVFSPDSGFLPPRNN